MLCSAHYARALRAGAIERIRERDPVKRFWSKVRRTATCWVWTGSKTHGYGQIHFEGRQRQAHRVAYVLEVGPIPAGLDLDHLCRNRACVRPNHLEPVTPGENLRRGFGASGVNVRKTHCPAGHEYTAGNTYMKDGNRKCRVCNHARSSDRAAKAREARRSRPDIFCRICGKTFTPPDGRQRLCSDKCRRESNRQSQRRFWARQRVT